MPLTETAAGSASRGPLHEILTRGLPDLRNKRTGLISMKKLAEALDITKQSVYQNWFYPDRPNRVPATKIQRLIDLSASQKSRPADYEPLTAESLLPFVATWEQRGS
jgi:hypothetical protein